MVTRRDQPFVEIMAPGTKGQPKPPGDLKSRLEAIPGGDDPVALIGENPLGQQGDEVLVEIVEAVSQKNVAVERFAGELGQYENAAVVRMDAVADGDVDEPEPPGDGDGRLAADLGQGKEAAPLPAGQDDRNDFRHDALPHRTMDKG